MTWWAVGSAAVGLAGSAIASDSARGAANSANDQSAAAIAEQRRQYDTSRADYQPYRDIGYGALAQLAASYGIPTGSNTFRPKTLENFDAGAYLQANPDVAQSIQAGVTPNAWQHYQDFGSKENRPFTYLGGSTGGTPAGPIYPHDVSGAEVQNDPGYAFGMQQGQQAIDRKIAASGGRVSGAAIKAAGRFGTDYATTKYGEAYQRRQDRLNRLSALAGIGQTATAGTTMAGANSTNAISGVLQNQGDINASARLAQGNIWGNAFNSGAAMIGRQYRGGGSGSSGMGVPTDNWSGQGYY
jgi:hypothetical protein